MLLENTYSPIYKKETIILCMILCYTKGILGMCGICLSAKYARKLVRVLPVHKNALLSGSFLACCNMIWSYLLDQTRWLEFGLVNRTGAKVLDLYFLKALPLGCSKLMLGNLRISIPVRHWTKNQFSEVILLNKVKIFNKKSKNFMK